MLERYQIKERAKSLFKSNYWMNVGLFAIFMAITAAASSMSTLSSSFTNLANSLAKNNGAGSEVAGLLIFMSILFSIIGIATTIFLAGPISVSKSKAAVSVYDGERPNFGHILFGFRDGMYWKSVGGMALTTLFVALAAMVMVIPFIIIMVIAAVSMGVSSAELSVNYVTGVFAVLAALFVIAACIPIIIVSLGLSQVPYVIAEEGKTGMNAIRRSWELMRGRKWNYFVFGLSFIGWGLLTVLTFGVLGIFYTNPYVSIAHGGYYRELRNAEAALM